MNGLPGLSIEENRKLTAWGRAIVVPGYDARLVRKDVFGWFIQWADYGNRDSAYGWEIDHAVPTILGGIDGLQNLRALHWRNNASMGGLLGNR
jgi:hypothetical protein